MSVGLGLGKREGTREEIRVEPRVKVEGRGGGEVVEERGGLEQRTNPEESTARLCCCPDAMCTMCFPSSSLIYTTETR